MRTNTTQTCIAGEYYVLAELARRDAIASMTLRNTKGVDILVAPLRRREAFKVEVKTATSPPSNAALFHEGGRCFHWRLSKKHETIKAPNLIYVFVWLPEAPTPPNFFVVKSSAVAKYVKWEHAHWLKTKGDTVKDSDMRLFRIPETDPEAFQDNWKLLGLISKRQRNNRRT